MKLPGDVLGPAGIGALQGAVRGAGRMSDEQGAAAIRGAPVEGVSDSHAAGMRIAPALANGDTAKAKAALLASVAHATAHMPDEAVSGVAEGLAGGKSGEHGPAAPSAYERALNGLLLLAHPQAWLPEPATRDQGPQTRRIGDPAAEGY